jgi:hypothetical protein
VKAARIDDETALPAAVDELYRAVGGLIDPVKELVNGSVMAGPSPYEHLVNEIPAKSCADGFTAGVARSLPNVWCDALDLRIGIDSRSRKMQPAGDSTPHRLRLLASRRWRPQDTRLICDYATEIESWQVSIRALLEPEHVKHITAPCPNCGTRWVYRQHAGETVRKAALQVVAATGCTCQNCKSTWTPDRYLFLCRLLQIDLPNGVLA